MSSPSNDLGARNQMLSEVTEVILKAVNLTHVDKSTVHAETVLTQGGLGLDSVDILEAVVAIEQHFGIKVPSAESGREHFRSLGTIADFVIQMRAS